MANPTNLRTDIYVDMTSGNHYALLDGEVCSVVARATKFSDRYNYTTGYVQVGVVINSKWKVTCLLQENSQQAIKSSQMMSKSAMPSDSHPL